MQRGIGREIDDAIEAAVTRDDFPLYGVFNTEKGYLVNVGFFGQQIFETRDEARKHAHGENVVVAITQEGEPAGVEAAIEASVAQPDGADLDERAEKQALGYANAMFQYQFGSGDMRETRINSLVAEIASRHWDGPGEIRTVNDSSQAILVNEAGDDIRHWDFWVGIEAAADNAEPDRRPFVEEVSGTVLGSVGEVLRESRDATS